MKSFKEFLTEKKKSYEVTVSVKDARKTLDVAKDMFRGEYKTDGSNSFIFKDEDTYQDFIKQLKKSGIEVQED